MENLLADGSVIAVVVLILVFVFRWRPRRSPKGTAIPGGIRKVRAGRRTVAGALRGGPKRHE